MNDDLQLDGRALRILKILIERYIRAGQPVGSKALVEEGQLDLSPATVRSIMADLEEAGYIQSPHTSSGRVPTAKGYRLFVDRLLTAKPLTGVHLTESQQGVLKKAVDERGLAASASSLLSNLTHLAGVVTLPKRERATLTQVEFLPLSAQRILVVLVFNGQEVQNRIIHVQQQYTPSQLQQAGNYLTQHCAGKDLTNARADLMRELQDERLGLESMLRQVLDLAEQAFQEKQETDYVLAGEANLLDIAEESGISRLRALFDAFTQKRAILHLLDQCVHANGVQIFIGSESGHEALKECSVITAPYAVKGELVGVLGVIGPTRIAYEQVISAVDVTARLLSAVLAEREGVE